MPDFIKTLYQNILSRDPESQSVIEKWTNHTNSYGIASTIAGFFTSDEFKARHPSQDTIVDKLYRSILGREPEPEGKNHWLRHIKKGDSMQVIVNGFVDSAEFRLKVENNVVPHPVFWP
jgi:hypothetical protein